MNENAIKSITSILSSKIIGLIISVTTTPIIVRLLGSGEYGAYAYALSIFSLTTVFVDSNIFDGVRKYAAEDKESTTWQKSVFFQYSILTILISVIVVIMLSVIFELINVSNSIDLIYPLLLIVSLLIISKEIYTLIRGFLMGIGHEKISEPLEVLFQIITSISAIVLIWVGFGATGALLGQVVGSVVSGMIGLYLINTKINLLDDAYTSLRDSALRLNKEFISFGGKNSILTISIFSMYHVDLLLLGYFSSNEVTGLYKAALVLAEFIWFVPIAIEMGLVHISSGIWSSGRPDELEQISKQMTRYTTLVSLLMIAGILVLGSEFVVFYFGTEFSSSIEPLLLLLPGVFGFAVARPLIAVGRGCGKIRPFIFAAVVSAIINLLLNLLLIPSLGMIGAAIATSFAYATILFTAIFASGAIGFYPTSSLIFSKLAPPFVITVLSLFTLTQLQLPDVIKLLILPPIGTIIFVIISVKSGFFSKSEIRTAKHSTNKILESIF